MRRTAEAGKAVFFFGVTLILVAITAFCITGTVMSKSRIDNAELENYYREQESRMLRETKDLLEEMGYKNSGVTLTRMVDEAGNREYTFTIHHGKIDKMSEQERCQLAEELVENSVLLADCSFYHEFLMYE